jgi:hypothetical protein
MFVSVITLQPLGHSLTVRGESGPGSRKGSQKPRLFAFGNAHLQKRKGWATQVLALRPGLGRFIMSSYFAVQK